MAREDVLANIEANQNLDHSSIGSIFFLLAGNSLIDSAAVNSFAKTNPIAFQVGIETGIYANNPILGGNFLYNFANKLGFKPKTNSWGSHLNFLANEDLAKGTKLGDVVQGFAEANDLSYNTEVIRGGFGFSYRKNNFFKTLKKYNTGNFIDSRFYSQSINGKTISSPKLIKYGDEEAISFFRNAFEQNGNKGFKTKSFKQYIDSVKKLEVGSDERKVAERIFKDYFGVDDISKLGSGEKFFKRYSRFNKFMEEAGSSIAWNADSAGTIFKNIMNNSGAAVQREILDSLVKDGMKIKGYSGNLSQITREVIDDAAAQVGKRYATQSTFQKFMGSRTIRFMTGNLNLLPKGFNLPFALTTAALGVTASIGQSNAVNNYITSSLYNTSDADYYISDRSVESIGSSYRISDLNLQSLVSAYSNINTARRYMNDLDPLGIEYSEEYGMDTHTLEAE